MASKKEIVNLDALILREDLEVSDETTSSTSRITSISANDLKSGGFLLASLRKPDFQRETSAWEPEKITRFIMSFVSGEFIPSVILWKSTAGLVFTIDGSHRLSSLIAWINDDYGDGELSMEAFAGAISDGQRKMAQQTRDLVNRNIGAYDDYCKALTAKYPLPETSALIEKARHMVTRALTVQWIDGNVENAETSFFNINQQAVPIDPTEITLLKNRRTPCCIAARAIVNGGKGHKYWGEFSHENQLEIERLSESIYRLLCEPLIQRPIKTLDMPYCDKSVNMLTLIYDFITLTNDQLQRTNDCDGTSTVSCLKQVNKVMKILGSSDPCSLGLHPIVYCYSIQGNFRAASFYAAVMFVFKLTSDKKRLDQFIKNRSAFESFLHNNDAIIRSITNSRRRSLVSAGVIIEYYLFLLDRLNQGCSIQEIANEMKDVPNLKSFASVKEQSSEKTSPNFTQGNKSEIFIRSSFSTAARCSLCGGLLHMHSVSIDHIQRKQDGGVGVVENGQIAHPYCNSGVKN